MNEEELQELIRSKKFNDPIVMLALSEEDRTKLIDLATLDFLFSQSAKFRGRIIDITIFLEMVIGEILGNYFTKKDTKKNLLLKSLILDRQNLSTKINWLKKILKLEHKEIYEKYKNELKNLDKLIDRRNNMAHSLLDSSESFLNEIKMNPKPERIRINYYQENEFKREIITKEMVEMFYHDCFKAIGVLQEIEKQIL